MIKDMLEIQIGSILTGTTLNSIGSNMVGSLSGIGNATQSLVAAGFLGHTASKAKSWLK